MDGTDSDIVYRFERDYLKPGLLSPDGTIDFRERGEIPFVSPGDVLAEKIPPREGRDGINVYGESISRPEVRDLPLVPGKGVRISSDGLRATAVVGGNPKIGQNGKIYVNDAYSIEGDVDFTTGHVKFDRNVYITGSVKSGFRVEAIDEQLKNFDPSKARPLSMSRSMEIPGNQPTAEKMTLPPKNLDEADRKIKALQDQQALLATRLKRTENDIAACADAVKIREKEKRGLKRLNQSTPPRPIVEVTGDIMGGTRINGRWSGMILTRTRSRSRIMEINTRPDEGSSENWEMIVTNL